MVALALVVLVGLVSAKWFAAREASRSQQAARVAQNVAEMQAAIQRQQMTVQRQAAAMNDKIQRQVAEMNINELMDKVEQRTRIPLPPTPSPPTRRHADSVVAVLKAESGGAVATIASAAKAEEVDAELAAEAKAAVAAIAEDDARRRGRFSWPGNPEIRSGNPGPATDDEKSEMRRSRCGKAKIAPEDEIDTTGGSQRTRYNARESPAAERPRRRSRFSARDVADAESISATADAANQIVERTPTHVAQCAAADWVDLPPKHGQHGVRSSSRKNTRRGRMCYAPLTCIC